MIQGCFWKRTVTSCWIEDNPNDEEQTVRALKQANIANDLVVARDGVERLDYLFGTGAHAHRDSDQLPTVIVLDLKLPKLDGLEVLERLDDTTCRLASRQSLPSHHFELRPPRCVR